jgi:ABC-type dipeptide/oligopeptide/nickel transport system permease component
VKRFLLNRFAGSAIVLLGVSVITFALARVIPSNPAVLYIGPRARPDEIERVTHQLGLDQPLPAQYLTYIRDMLGGDWGTSIATKRPVLDEILTRLPATLELIAAAMVIAIPLGIALGVLSARWRGRPPDIGVRLVSIIGVSLPAFFLALVLQVLFFRELNVLPLAGRTSADLRFTNPLESVTGFNLIDSVVTGNWVALGDTTYHLILPAIALAAYPLGLIARMTRSSMLETLDQDYIRTARAFGLRRGLIDYRLALRNAILPVLTVIGLTFGYLLTGSFFVEIVFNWPGLGMFAVHSLLSVDYPSIMGIALLGAIGYVVINLIVDLAQAWLDPRVRLT